MSNCVKITRNYDGEKIPYAKWCLSLEKAGGSMALCTRQYYGDGENECEFEERDGKITCPDCIAEIKYFKSIKL